MNNLVSFGSTLQTLEAHLNHLDDVLQNKIDPEAIRELSGEVKRLQGLVEIRNLTFGYSSLGAPLIKSLNILAKLGQRVAIVGRSGSGKSTLAKLICGLYTPWTGEIYLDGIPRTKIPRTALADSLAMVEQNISWFSGTIRENLTLWNLTISDADLAQACKDAEIFDLIQSLPDQWEAELIEGGVNLSGGQRQRLEIARALVGNPSVLVLDEATSALDAETEFRIVQNLEQRGCTCIWVAHRLSTIRDCNAIVVLEQGEIVQCGTHETLWQQDGAYRQLLESEER